MEGIVQSDEAEPAALSKITMKSKTSKLGSQHQSFSFSALVALQSAGSWVSVCYKNLSGNFPKIAGKTEVQH